MTVAWMFGWVALVLALGLFGRTSIRTPHTCLISATSIQRNGVVTGVVTNDEVLSVLPNLVGQDARAENCQ